MLWPLGFGSPFLFPRFGFGGFGGFSGFNPYAAFSPLSPLSPLNFGSFGAFGPFGGRFPFAANGSCCEFRPTCCCGH
jgi:hypothetical protein